MLTDDLRRFDLNLLVVFHALMAERNVSRAAARLFLGQPAVSHALSRLREACDDPLFVRAGGAMQPTPRAVELGETVAELLEGIRTRVLIHPRFEPASTRATVRLGVLDYAEVAVMRPMLQAIRREAPALRVVMRALDPDAVGGELEAGQIDLAVGVVPLSDGRLLHEVLFQDDFVCAFDAVACGVQPPLGLDRYLDLPHMLLSPRGELEGIMDPVLRAAGLTRFVFAATPHLMTLPYLLRGCRAVAVLPRRFAAHCAALVGLAISDLPIGAFTYTLDMVWHPRTEQDALQSWLRALVRRVGADPPPAGQTPR